MANIKSAQKRARQNVVKRAVNGARRSALKTAVKKVLEAVKLGDFALSSSLLRDAESKIARARGKGVLHANTAARKVSRLAKKVSALSRSDQ